MLQHQNENQWALLNADDPESQKLIEHHDGEIFPFSTEEQLSHGVFVKAHQIIIKHAELEEVVMTVDEFPLKGKHNLSNALATIGACYLAFHQAGKSAEEMKILIQQMATVLRSVEAVPQRLELVDTVDGVEYYNDSASTVPESTLAAVEALKKEGHKLILIAGGRSKGSDYLPFLDELELKVDAVAWLSSPLFEELGEQVNNVDQSECFDSLQQAVRWAAEQAQEGDVVLFSPAAEYFSWFRDKMPDYKQFRHIVSRSDISEKTSL